jgi:2-amino-4-hydroxy-6-hydroxymethyldihydropteridine diphosphokinase
MKTYTVFLGLGSNIGQRHGYLNAATTAIKQIAGVNVIWASSVYESDPVGKTDQPKFLNAVLELETTLLPPALLGELKAVEQSLGRTVTERWGPREIDIDILLYDGLVYEDETLRVPHSELERRKFVLIPLCEIAPAVVHPVTGLTATEMARACPDTTKVVKTSFSIFV